MNSKQLREMIIDLSEKHSAFDIHEAAIKQNAMPSVSIGFLGEFSSGKSTLINALIGRKLLPAMKNPTSKSIVYVEPHEELDSVFYYRFDQGKDRIPISATEFADIALGKIEGEAIITIPARDILIPGIRLVDTPGIESLNDTDTDITFGCLPFLDGAVICQDINNGTLTDSALKFLQRSDINPLLDRVIVTLTYGDTKPSQNAREKIRKHVIDILRKNVPGLKNPEERVIITSGKALLEDNNSEWLESFETTYRNQILSRHRTMIERRVRIAVLDLADTLSEFIEMKISTITLKDDELRERQKLLHEDAKAIEDKRNCEHKRLQATQNHMEDILMDICNSYVSKFSVANDHESIRNTSEEFNQELMEVVEKGIMSFQEGFAVPQVNFAGSKIEAMIESTMRSVELGKKLGTAILFAAIIPGGGVADVLAGAGGAAVSDRLDGINPVEYIGDWAGNLIKSSKLKSALPILGKDLSERIHNQLLSMADLQVFIPLEQKLKNAIDAVNEAERERRKSEKEKSDILSELMSDKESLISVKESLGIS